MTVALPILDTKPQRPIFAQGPQSVDAIKLLRISVTDRCNLRCMYCMPADGVPFDDKADLLAPRDFVAVAQAAQAIGVDHFKITGGEPTARADLLEIVEGIARLNPGDLSMTTNGLTLERQARDLRNAGLQRLTVSWDSMLPDRFARITGNAHLASEEADQRRRGTQLLDRLRNGIESALAAGFTKLKFNVVVLRGINDDEVTDFARLTIDRPWTVRFIEYMPLGNSQLTDHADDYTVDNEDVKRAISAALGELTPADRRTEPGVGPAQVYRLPNAQGRLGFISAMSKPFCETCNRMRLTARGELRACLFDGGEVNILPALHPRPDIPRLADMMRRCVPQKPETHSHRGNRAMSQLGG